MGWEELSLWLQAGTLLVGGIATLWPPTRPWLKALALVAIVGLGAGGLFTARESNARAEAKSAELERQNASAQAEIVRLSKANDARVALVQQQVADVSKRLAAKGINTRPASPNDLAPAVATAAGGKPPN